jgi:hypothetical protein
MRPHEPTPPHRPRSPPHIGDTAAAPACSRPKGAQDAAGPDSQRRRPYAGQVLPGQRGRRASALRRWRPCRPTCGATLRAVGLGRVAVERRWPTPDHRQGHTTTVTSGHSWPRCRGRGSPRRTPPAAAEQCSSRMFQRDRPTSDRDLRPAQPVRVAGAGVRGGGGACRRQHSRWRTPGEPHDGQGCGPTPVPLPRKRNGGASPQLPRSCPPEARSAAAGCAERQHERMRQIRAS